MNSYGQTLLEKFRSRQAIVGVVGLGYVGLPLALRFAEAGLRVIGLDIDPEKPRKLAAGHSYINYIPDAAISAAYAQGFTASTDFKLCREADALIICVPTPLNRHREPDLSYVLDTARELSRHLRPGQVVSLESTTYPGTTDEELLPVLQQNGLKVGENLFLVYSPERQDPGNRKYDTRNIPKLVGGITPDCCAVGEALYAAAVDRVVPVSSTRVAELAKLLENIHRAVNIGLVNELKIVADRMGIDIFEVIDAAATKPFGFVPYYPGPGLGGHCIPIDPFYLTWKAREYGVHTRFIELAGEINHAMPEWVVRKTIDALNQNGKAMRGSRILILGIAYKKNVDDLRESPALELLERFQQLGAEVQYSDPHIPVIPPLRRGHIGLGSVALTAASLAACDAVVIAADHDAFDYAAVARHAPLVIDTRGVYRSPLPNVVRA
ncbi:MAG TPA: nucleotide sugar dehydrogenase [Nevskia sp.]|nr:nucleotide sugar dehydrogenase [Nevskia sp.]